MPRSKIIAIVFLYFSYFSVKIFAIPLELETDTDSSELFPGFQTTLIPAESKIVDVDNINDANITEFLQQNNLNVSELKLMQKDRANGNLPKPPNMPNEFQASVFEEAHNRINIRYPSHKE